MKKTYAWAAIVIVAALMFLTRMKSPERPTGVLKLLTPNAEVQLQSGDQRVTLSREKGPVKLFVGTYVPGELALTNGPYRLASTGPFGKLAAITVSDNQTGTLDFGPPLKVTADVNNPKGPQVTVGLTITGKAGESYPPAANKKGVRLSAPAIKILDGKGKVLGQGVFKFG